MNEFKIEEAREKANTLITELKQYLSELSVNQKILISAKNQESTLNQELSINKSSNLYGSPSSNSNIRNDMDQIRTVVAEANQKISYTIKALIVVKNHILNAVLQLRNNVKVGKKDKEKIVLEKLKLNYQSGIDETQEYIYACERLVKEIDIAISNAKNVSGSPSVTMSDSTTIDDIVGTGSTAQVKEKGNYDIELIVLDAKSNYWDSVYNNQSAYDKQPYLSRTNDKRPESPIEKIVNDNYGIPIIDNYKPKYNNFLYGKYL